MRCVQLGRWPTWPRWPVLLAVVWLVLGAAVLALSQHLGQPVQLCLFKRITGVACPTCGFTRGMFSLLHGHPVEAWLYNPLLFSFLGVLGAAVLARMMLGRGLRWHLTRTERILGWTVTAALFAANWFYVIRCTG